MKQLFTRYLLIVSFLFLGGYSATSQTLSLTVPNGGEAWGGGTYHLITWSYANIDAISIDYSLDNGLTWVNLTPSYPASALSYSWRIPCTGSAKAKVRLTNTLGYTQSQSNATFTIPEATVSLSYPVGGEVYGNGTGQYVTWATTGTSTLALEYTIDGGTTWTSIGSFPATDGYCNWVTPNTASNKVRIRAYNIENPIDRDSTASLFSVNSIPTINSSKYLGGLYDGYKMCSSLVDTLNVLSPNGGEVLTPASSTNITWGFRNIDRVNIQYTIDNGSNWTLIDSNIVADLQTYPWAVPNLPSSQCLVKVSATDRPLTDVSNAVFIINAAYVHIEYPNGGETFGTGTGQYIQWTSNSVKIVKLEYSTDNGTTWTTIGTATATNQYMNWIPPTSSNQYLLRISDYSTATLNDVTDGNFSVIPIASIDNTKYLGGSYDGYSMANSYADSIKVTSPNGGEVWLSASTHNITWTYNNVDNVSVEYSLDDGISWNTLAANIPASQLSYSWAVPTTPSNTCKVRVKDISRSLVDVSDSAFIIPTTYLQVVYPNGGESFGVGTGQYIEWNYANLQTIKLEYSTDSGATWLTIGSFQAADKYANWVVPNTVTSKLLIRATDIVNANYTDQSNGVFSSTGIPTIDATKYLGNGGANDGYSMYSFFDSYLQVRKPNGGEVWGNGTTQKIQWATLNNSENIILDYTTDNGTNWTTLLNNVADTPNTYNWLISSQVSSTCKVRARTVSGTLIDLSDNFFTIANPNGIVTSAITGNSFCPGQTTTVNFSLNKTTFNTGNQFIVQLSDSAGTFAGAVENIGQVAGTTPQAINVTFPARYYQSSAYRLRVIGTSPPTIGTDNGTNFTIKQLPNVNLGNDTTICSGTSLILNANNVGSAYLWSTSAKTQTISVSNAGVYSVKVTNSCGATFDTIVVSTLSAPVVNVGVDTAICLNSALTLNAANVGANYQWSTGSTSQTINVVTPGNYAVAVSNKCGIGRDTIKITNVPTLNVNLGLDTAICSGQSITLDAGNAGIKGVSYLWSNGLKTQTITTSSPGSYWVNVNNGCTIASGQTTVINGAFKVAIAGNLSICKGNATTLTATGGNSYKWSNGTALSSNTVSPNATTSYTVTSKNYYGCTATAQATVTVASSPTATVSISVGKAAFCKGSSATLSANTGTGLSYQWLKDGATIANATQSTFVGDTTGSYSVQVTNTNGCTNVSTPLVLTSNPLPIASITASGSTIFCIGSNVLLSANVATGISYQWQQNSTPISGSTGANYYATNSGSFSVKVTNTVTGCSNSSNAIGVTSRLSSTSSQTISNKGNYVWHNTTYTKSGTYTFDTINAAGCDSLITLNLTIIPTCTPTSSTSTQSTCGSYTWNGTTYTSSGSYVYKTVNAGGCDSIATLILTIKAVTTSTTTASICAGGSYTFNGTAYTTAGNYTKHLTNAVGCDSAATLNLTVKAVSTSTTNASICAGTSYTFNGTVYTTAGTYVKHLTNAAGCDSAATLNLTVKATSTSTTNVSICSGASYTFNGIVYTTAGTYTKHLTNAAGCDSAATLNLMVKAVSTSTTNASICAGTSYTFNGTVYTTAGTYVKHLTNAAGCDSAATLNLTVKSLSASTTNASICAGASYTFNGTVYTTAGSYTKHLTNAAGCDSAATLNLTVKATSTSITNATIAAGGSYTFNGTSYKTSGTYTVHLTNSLGCDSTATLNLTVVASTAVKTVFIKQQNNVCNTGSITVPVLLKNFSNIGGFQGSLQWDHSVLKYAGFVTGIGGVSQSLQDTAQGQLGYLWSDNTAKGYTSFTDSTVAFSIKFNVTSGFTGNTIVGFGQIPSGQEIDTFDVVSGFPVVAANTLYSNGTVNFSGHPTSSSDTLSVCATALPYSWNGLTFTAAGSKTVTLTNANGCDSVATLTLKIKNASTSTTNASICAGGSYTFNGTVYTTAGTYTKHLTNAAGCDSAATLNLTVKLLTTSTTNASICVGSSYTFNGTVYNTAGSYTKHLTNAAGCDSAATLNLTVKSLSTSTTNASICAGGSYTFNGTAYTIAGSYTAHLTNSVGCDSAATLNLTINQPTTATVTKTACSSYTWHGKTYTASGSYTFDSLNAKGCDSLTTLVLTINQPTTATITKTACSSYNWHGKTYTASGSYTFDSLNAKGCDSLTTLNLTINQPTTATVTKTACSSYAWHGTTYTASGSYTFDSLNAKGCDSLTTLVLTINQPTTATITKTACSSYNWHGKTYTASGSYTFDSLNAKGCDSLTTLVLTINQPTTATITKTACSSYSWHGKTYTTSGSYTFDSLNAKGCDSLTTLVLTINQPTTATITKTACSSYTWHGKTYITSGSYTFDSLNAKGCDSLTTLVLTINNPTTATVTKTACSSYTWHGKTYITSGSYTFDSLNAKGCDSLTTLVLTINNPTTASIAKTACSSYSWHGKTYTASGSYTFDSLNAKGCDSLTTLVLTINQPTTATITKTACSSYSWHGKTYTTSGSYTFDSLNAKGCDSLTTLVLTINQPTTATITKTACSSYFWHGTTYTASGSYTFDSLNAKGCDSLTTLVLTINQPTTATITKTACSSYTWHGKTYTASGSYTFDSLNAKGCDSLTTLVLTINQPTTATITKTACSSYTWHGTTYTASGSYTFDSLNAKGCDSLTTLVLTINQPTTATITKTACSSYSWHGTTYTTSGSYTFDSLNAKGCDSLTTLNLTINQPTTATVTKTACSSYTWHGKTYTASGSYTFDSLNAKGCDSLTTLVLTINQPTTATITKTACSSYNWHGKTYTASGSYTFDSLNAKGCDSLTTLVLTINQPTTATIVKTACSSYSWHGKTYTASGSYTYDSLNVKGCDSLTTLVLTINQPTTATITKTINQGDSILFNGKYYKTAGKDTSYLTNSVGCDSIAILNLTVNSIFTFSGTIKNPAGNIIPWIPVSINDTGTIICNNGNYSFNTYYGSNYTVTPSKNNDLNKTNGVSVLDVLLTQAHILGKSLFNSPYKTIAADVDNSGTVSVLDILYTKRLILGIDTSFPGKRLWAFVDSSYHFADSLHPFPYKDSISSAKIASNQVGKNFVGLKLGDVNWDWNSATEGLFGNRSNAIELYHNDIQVANETEIRVPVRVKNFKDILGMQYTLNYNKEALALKSIENNRLNVEYNTNQSNEGKVSFLWADPKNSAKSLIDGDTLMELVFERKGSIVNEAISLSSDITRVEATNASYTKLGIVKTSGQITSTPTNAIAKERWTVSPNPTIDGKLKLTIVTNEAKRVTIEVVNVLGKTCYKKEQFIPKGVSVTDVHLGQSVSLMNGLYYIRVNGVEDKSVKPILLTK